MKCDGEYHDIRLNTPNAPRHSFCVHTTPLATNLPQSHMKCRSLVIGSQEKRKQTRTKYKQTRIKCKQTRKSQGIYPPCSIVLILLHPKCILYIFETAKQFKPISACLPFLFTDVSKESKGQAKKCK